MPKTTCQAHRREGYFIQDGVWLCRVCRESADQHETTDETLARLRAEAHPAGSRADVEAETIACATGSTGATVRYETRHADGTLTVDAVGSWSARCYHPLSCRRCGTVGEACGTHAPGQPGHESCKGSAAWTPAVL